MYQGIPFSFNDTNQNLKTIKNDNSTQPKVFVLNAGLWDIPHFCLDSNERNSYNISKHDIGTCAEYFHKNFKRLLDLVTFFFPSDLIIFRTANAGWMKWGNFGLGWPTQNQSTILTPHTVQKFNDIALKVIRDSGYNVKVYDLFWMTWSRPDDTKVGVNNNVGDHIVHLVHDTLKVSIRKLLTLVAGYLGCFH